MTAPPSPALVDCIGNMPLVRLNKLSDATGCEILGTAGNTGIGLAVVGNCLGYPTVIVSRTTRAATRSTRCVPAARAGPTGSSTNRRRPPKSGSRQMAASMASSARSAPAARFPARPADCGRELCYSGLRYRERLFNRRYLADRNLRLPDWLDLDEGVSA